MENSTLATEPDSTSNPSNADLVNMPDPSRLILGLRDTGYDLYTACADIVDNSIAANATNVNIRMDLTADGRKFVYFGDLCLHRTYRRNLWSSRR